ncbi:MAG: metalloregulator ArsR/SmtB family transcription factor [Mariprofundaceae bacterium]|nr:metalloregulator ArsR/SmtB family transcription factor [Mariprofundaceae bacterium]
MQMPLLFKALGDPVRLRLFCLLALKGEQCVCHLTRALRLPQSTISRHLGVLRSSGLVTARRDGKWMHYQPADDVPEELTRLLARSHETSVQAGQDMERMNASPDC